MADLLEKFRTVHGGMDAKKERVQVPTNTIANINKNQDINTIHNSAIKIFSKKLKAHLWLVHGDMQELLISEGVQEPVFTFSDIQQLNEKMSNKALKQICNVKKVFTEASILSTNL